MSKIIFSLLILSLSFLNSAFSQGYRSISYESTSQMSQLGDTDVKSKYWEKDNKLRIESIVAGQEMIIIFDGIQVYSYSPKQKLAFLLPFSELSQKTPIPDYRSNPNLVLKGQDTIEGRLCDLYEDVHSDATTKIWIDKELEFPIRSETSTEHGKIVTRIFNIKKDITISDDLFTLPKEAKLIKAPFQPFSGSDALSEKLQQFKNSDSQGFDGVGDLLEGVLDMENAKDGAKSKGININADQLQKQLKEIEKMMKDFSK